MKFFVHVLSTYLKYTGNIKFYKEWYNMLYIYYITFICKQNNLQ